MNLASLGADVDSDDDGGTLVYSTLDTPPGGSATINGTTLSLSPGSDFQSLAVGETTSFTVKVQAKDKHGATATNDISVKVTGVNDAPTLNAGALGAKEDGDAVMLDLASLGDDVDSDDDAGSLVYTLVGPAPQHGVATLSGSMLSYAPGQAFQGLAQGETTAFTLDVKATDKHGASTVNTVTVTVTGENDDPTLAAGKLTAFENGGAVTLDLSTLGDDVDSDDDGSTLTYAAPFPGPNGSTVSVSGTTLTFVPGTAFEQLPEMVPADFSVGIEATDRHGDKAFSHVAVRLIGKNDAPTLQAGVFAAQEDGGPVMLNLATLGDDIDNDDGPGSLLYALAAPVPAGQGAVQIAGTSLTFTPGTDFQGLALDQKADVVLQLQATDKHGATAVNTVTVTVTGKNDAPTLKSGTLALTEDGGPATLSLAPLGDDIDSDNDGSNLVYTTGAGLPQGTATVNAATLSVDPGNGYQYLAAGETKTFDLALKATDAHGLFQNNVVTVSVTGMNDAPTLGGDTAGGVTAMAGNQTLTLEQWTGYPGPYAEASLRSHASANKANYTVSTTVVDFTDDPGGFAGEIPGSTPWPAAAATGTSGTGGINDQFFARVTGQISVPVTDTYTFRTFNDDGVYLRVNN
ncbi:MAG TPA: Ig-like domain-containing protein, partial [Myxococcota bacterium]